MTQKKPDKLASLRDKFLDELLARIDGEDEVPLGVLELARKTLKDAAISYDQDSEARIMDLGAMLPPKPNLRTVNE